MRVFSNEIKRVVVKVGTSSITHNDGAIDKEKIYRLSQVLSEVRKKGYDVVLVSSGAVATGAEKLGIPRPITEISTKQAAASVGQVALMDTYSQAFEIFGYNVGQILVTNAIENDPVMNQNAVNTFNNLFKMGAVPIVNENDTISTEEIKLGDNDTLSAIVSNLSDADLLILLSDVDGFYTADPRIEGAKLISEVDELTEEIYSYAGDAGTTRGTGGMVTKLRAAKICMDNGIDMVLTDSKDLTVIHRILDGEDVGTIFRGGANVTRNR